MDKERFKAALPVLQKILKPDGRLHVLLIAVSAVCLPAVFLKSLEDSAFAYIMYAVSAYTVTVTSVWGAGAVKKVKALLHSHEFTHRYLTDLAFKAEVSLYGSFAVNLLYSIYKSILGIYYCSALFGAMAFYYIVVGGERFLLLKTLRQKEQDEIRTYRRYRFCGYALLALTAAVISISFYTVFGGEKIRYPGYIVYAAAGYVFYTFTTAVINVVKYRKIKNPIYSASKILSMSNAAVSVFFLQTAMFEAFGSGEPWQNIMSLCTGLGVLVMVFAMAVFMIRNGNRNIKERTPFHKSA